MDAQSALDAVASAERRSAEIATYRRVTGVWPSGQGMMVHFVAVAVVMLGAGIGSYLLASSYGVGWWLPAVAVVTAVLMTLLSRGFDIAYARKHGAR